MHDVRIRASGWIVSPKIIVLFVVAAGAVALVLYIGDHDAAARRIPTPSSVVVQTAQSGQATGPTTLLDQGDAVQLAKIVNALGHFPHARTVCPSDNGGADLLTFATARGPVVVTVDLTGCNGVKISSNGSDWGAPAERWDGPGVLRAAITSDVARARSS
jgi:hypothetical protein